MEHWATAMGRGKWHTSLSEFTPVSSLPSFFPPSPPPFLPSLPPCVDVIIDRFSQHMTLCDPMDCSLQAPLSAGIHGRLKNTGVNYNALLQGISLSRDLTPPLQLPRWIAYH